MKKDQLFINRFLSSHPEIAIATIDDLDLPDAAALLEALSPDQCVLILSRLMPYKSGKILERISLDLAVSLVALMSLSLAESILRVSDKRTSDQILNSIEPEKAKNLRRALSFNNDQVGAHLDPNVITLQVTMDVEKALELVKSSNSAVMPRVFVIDKEKNLVGYIEVTDLVKTPMSSEIKSFMKPVSQSAFAEMNAKDILDKWDDTFTDLPVIKISGEFLGTVSRASLTEANTGKSTRNQSAIKAGSALGELYTIGLTSLLGSSESNLKS